MEAALTSSTVLWCPHELGRELEARAMGFTMASIGHTAYSKRNLIENAVSLVHIVFRVYIRVTIIGFINHQTRLDPYVIVPTLISP